MADITADQLLAFLHGSGEIDGVWFGDKHPAHRGSFWWRKHLHLLGLRTEPQKPLRDALSILLRYIDANTCTHETTHRGGAIWTICDSCGEMWADDEGGFVPHQDSEVVAIARAALKRKTRTERK